MADKKSSKNTTEEDDLPAGFNPQAVYIGGESIADRVVPHIKKILIAVGVVAVILGIFFTFRWFQHRKAQKATSALMAALDEYRLEVDPVDPTDPKPGPSDPAPAPDAPRTFNSRAERADAVLAKLKNTGDARSTAALLEASLQFDAGRLDEAEAIYRKLAARKGIEGILAREGLGFVAEARALGTEGDARTAGLQGALAAFQKAQPDDAGPRRDYALYHEGRVLAQLGRKDDARTVLEKALEKASPDLEASIEVRLTQLEAKSLPAMPKPGTKPAPTPEPEPEEKAAPEKAPEPEKATGSGSAAAPPTEE